MRPEFPELTLHPLLQGMQQRGPSWSCWWVHGRDGLIQGTRTCGRSAPGSALRRGPQPAVPSADGSNRWPGSATMLVATAPVLHPDGRVLGARWSAAPLPLRPPALAEQRRHQDAGAGGVRTRRSRRGRSHGLALLDRSGTEGGIEPHRGRRPRQSAPYGDRTEMRLLAHIRQRHGAAAQGRSGRDARARAGSLTSSSWRSGFSGQCCREKAPSAAASW